MAFSPKTGFNSITPIQSFPGCLAPITSIEDELIVATQEGLAFFNIKKKTSDLFMERIRIEDKPENRFNDGKVDPAGRHVHVSREYLFIFQALGGISCL